MGNLNLALQMVKQATKAGCNFIKMQKKDVDNFYSKEKLDSYFSSPYGETYRCYRKMFEFEHEDFLRLDQLCKKLDTRWFATAQDIKSLDFFESYNLDWYKVASCNSDNYPFLKELAAKIPTDKTIVVSVAGKTLNDIEKTISIFPNHKIYILHCVAEYPCKPQNLHLGNIPVLINNFQSEQIRIGYSGHEIGFLPTLAAVDLGAEVIERHFCMSRHSFVHHIECSLTPSEFKEMVSMIHHKELRKKYKGKLPEEAFKSSFSMSPMEKAFLKENTYGIDYLLDESKFSN